VGGLLEVPFRFDSKVITRDGEGAVGIPFPTKGVSCVVMRREGTKI